MAIELSKGSYRRFSKTFTPFEERDHNTFYPHQGVSLDKNGNSYVWLDKNKKVKISHEIARRILFLLKISSERLRRYEKNNFGLTKKLVHESNCFKSVLFLLGVPLSFLEVATRDGGQAIDQLFARKIYSLEKHTDKKDVLKEINKDNVFLKLLQTTNLIQT